MKDSAADVSLELYTLHALFKSSETGLFSSSS